MKLSWEQKSVQPPKNMECLKELLDSRWKERKNNILDSVTGSQPVLPAQLENDIAEWIVGMQMGGFPVSTGMVITKANEIF